MEGLLLELLQSLEEIGNAHDEIYDTECREDMGDFIFTSFVQPTSGRAMLEEFGLYSPEGNQRVRASLERYVDRANDLCERNGITDFHERLSAFQNPDVATSQGHFFDDFFGWTDPADYDAEGNFLAG
jgi:hypothetical protein